MEIPLQTLKLGLLSFWTVWLALIFMTNLFGGLKALGVLPPSWKFASRNLQSVRQATALYRSPAWLPGLLFIMLVLWQGLAAWLFAAAWMESMERGAPAWAAINTAFAASLGIWAALMLSDEIFLQYEKEGSHAVQFIAQLATLASLHLLPA